MQKFKSIYDFTVTTVDNESTTLATYQHTVMLIVNVASFCYFTPQYADLERLYQQYKNKGFVVLGFPCNQFFSQEPYSEAKIKNFCSAHYQVSFPIFSKIKVNGKHTHPLYIFLKNKKASILGLNFIPWNFTKFLVNRDGNVVKRFSPYSKLEKLEKAIARLLLMD